VQMVRVRRTLAALTLAALGGAMMPTMTAAPAEAATITPYITDTFTKSNQLLTNAYAYSSPTSLRADHDGVWEMTSGSLFVRDNHGWSGKVQDGPVDATSTRTTGASVFRMRSQRDDMLNTRVTLRLRTDRYASTAKVPARDRDGVHLWLRYQSEENLYLVSMNRRDNTVVIKRKVPGGTSNGGTYKALGDARYTVPKGRWQDVEATVRNTGDDAVTITLDIDGKRLLTVVDRGERLKDGRWVTPLRSAGRVGVRGDNTEFMLDSIKVSPTSAKTVKRETVVALGTASSVRKGRAPVFELRAWRDGKMGKGVQFSLQSRSGNGKSWTTVRKVTANSQGRATVSVPASSTKQWRAVVSETSTATRGASATATVKVT